MRDFMLLMIMICYTVFMIMFFSGVGEYFICKDLIQYLSFGELILINLIFGYIFSIIFEATLVYDKFIQFHNESRDFAILFMHIVTYTLVPCGSFIVGMYFLYFSRAKLLSILKSKLS